ncbi:MAG: 50S ribosomal protein L31e [Candidatus Pacearchaeota archaeon]
MTDENVLLERIYTIPLRKEWLKVPKWKRAKKAMKAIREFVERHMKVYDSDIKIKISDWVNKAVWCCGIKNVPHKITVKVVKKSNEIFVDFVGLPKKFKQEEAKIKRKMEKALKKAEEKKEKEKKKEKLAEKLEEKVERREEKTEEEKMAEEEKKEREKILHKEVREQEKKLLKLSKKKEQIIHRKALEK